MAIPTKESVLTEIEKHLGVKLHPLSNKRIFYKGNLPDGGDVLVCSPESKMYPSGNGWVDLTVIQVGLLAEAKLSMLAIRLENNSVVYVNFSDLRPYLTKEAMLNNKREGDHWKLHVWTNRIKVFGNKKIFAVENQLLEQFEFGSA